MVVPPVPSRSSVLPDRAPDDREPELLSEPNAARLLARASELDELRRAGSSVADLRAAASEAGISKPAFDAALTEMQIAKQAPLPAVRKPASLRSTLRLVAASLAIVGGYTLYSYSVPDSPTEAAPPTAVTEEAIPLRCLSGAEAAVVARPILDRSWNTVVVNPSAPNVITIRATAAQSQQVKSALDALERGGSQACAAPIAPTATP